MAVLLSIPTHVVHGRRGYAAAYLAQHFAQGKDRLLTGKLPRHQAVASTTFTAALRLSKNLTADLRG